MKRYIILMLTLFFAYSCTDKAAETETPVNETKSLVLVPGLAGESKAVINYPVSDYFSVVYYIDNENFQYYDKATVQVEKSSGNESRGYIYMNNVLQSEDYDGEILFPENGGKMDRVTVLWPEENLRSPLDKDQSERASFLRNDWLKGELTNVAPQSRVSFTFNHERCKLTFTIVGTQAGKKIEYLEYAGYKAYCDPNSINAELMMDPADNFLSTDLFGKVKLEEKEDVDIFMLRVLPEITQGTNQNYTIEINI